MQEPLEAVVPEAGSVAVVEQVEVPDRRAAVIRRLEHHGRSPGAAVAGQGAADGGGRAEFVVGDRDPPGSVPSPPPCGPGRTLARGADG